jgi:hypothetical protein
VHFTPTSGGWLNQVERFFGLLTDRRFRRGTFGSVRELEAAIRDYLALHNQSPKPFTWTADADSILKNIARFVCELLTQDRNPNLTVRRLLDGVLVATS